MPPLHQTLSSILLVPLLVIPCASTAIASGDQSGAEATTLNAAKAISDGNDWLQRRSGILGGVVYDLLIHPNDPNSLIAASEDGIFVSADGAVNWAPVTDDEFGAVPDGQIFFDADFTVDATPRLLATRSCSLIASDDLDQFTTGPQFSPCVEFVDAHDTSANLILVGGSNEGQPNQRVALSDDGGMNFTLLDLGTGVDTSAVAKPQFVAGVAGSVGVAFISSEGGGLFISADSGDNWTDLTSNLIATTGANPTLISLSAFSISPADPDLWLVEASITGDDADLQGFFRSLDRGQTWALVEPIPSGATSFSEFSFDRANATRMAGRDRISTDGGATWQRLDIAAIDDSAVFSMALPGNDANTLYAAGFGFGVVKSTDNGANWTRRVAGLDAGYVESADIAADGTILAAAQQSGVFRSADSGVTWTEVFSAQQPGGIVRFGDVRFAPSDSFIAYAALSDPSLPLIKSVDQGFNWAAVNLGLAQPSGIGSIWIDPNDFDHVLVGTCCDEPRLLETTDGGANWVTRFVDPALAAADITGIAVDGQDPNTVYVSLESFSDTDGSVYVSANRGISWQAASTGLPAGIQPLTVVASPDGRVYTGNQCDGIFRSPAGAGAWESLAGNGDPGSCIESLHVAPGDPNRIISNEQRLTVNGGDSWAILGDLMFESTEIRFSADADQIVTSSRSNGVFVRAIDPGSELSGTIRDDQGALLGGAVVDAYDVLFDSRTAGTSTDANGEYRLRLPAGDYYVLISGGGLLVDESFEDVPCPGFNCDRLNLATPVSLNNDQIVDAQLLAGHRVSGTVTDQVSGDPINGTATLFDEMDRFVVPTGIVDGAYAFPAVPAGDYRIRFDATGYVSIDQNGANCDPCVVDNITPTTITTDTVIDLVMPRVGSSVEIDVQRPLGVSIADGATDNLGNLTLGANTVTYTVNNDGNIPLTLSEPVLSDPINVTTLQVLTAPDTNVAPAGSTTFTIGFENDANGQFSFAIELPNNDGTENPYDILVQGTIPALSSPILSAELAQGQLLVDNDGDGRANPSDTLRYGVILRNDGETAQGARVEFSIAAPDNTRFTRANRDGTIDGGMLMFDENVITAEFPNLAGDEAEFVDIVTFDLLIDNDFNFTEIEVQGMFEFGPTMVLTDDPSVQGVEDPTRQEIGRLSRVLAAGDDGEFGAASAMSGNLVLVGAPSSNGGQGSAKLFEIGEAGRLSEIATLMPPPDFAGAGYGTAVAIDGDTFVIGSRDADPAKGAKGNGKAVLAGLYRLNAGVPELRSAISENLGNDFGTAVAIDGDAVLLGAPGQMVGGADQAGAVYMFSVDTLLTGGEDPMDIIMPSVPQAMSRFGSSVACQNDKVVIGFPGPLGNALAGGAVLYDTLQQNLTPLAMPFNGSGEFGAAVALMGNEIYVGAPAAAGQGRVFVYDLDAALIRDFTANDIAPDYRFGQALTVDTGSVFVGSPAATALTADGTGPFGAVYEFSVATSTQMQKIGAFSESSATFEQQESFGFSVAAADGSILIGAPQTVAARGAAAFRPSDAFEPPDPDTLHRDGFEGLGPMVR